ncbi:nitroreductase [Treponema phagedenis]|uniref:Nitroreductase family protein n=1 Tax=Treponema phagedenis TaxID=162 RepID=A0A0B7H142_TREPH|nr:nitroreductase family protein [Treponema phagedenis]EFW38202.1 nitroreductase family protein [Treponema phagedenis F0421]NVP23179.1 nitroreductase family protein [Treponema phagedenis]QEJ94828.1 nitroreductase family protein [Treponema phagedenis]QEJ98014.1 nitroreductase family protein [Treponema phagedenis]QEK00732.1 nitroreductase family protein [Treponema phagedenis]
MSIIESLKQRRSYYEINKDIPISQEEIERKIKELTELVPDAFNMKSARLVLIFGDKHDLLWNEIYNVFEGKVPQEKIDSFKAGAGTILFLYDEETVKSLQEQFKQYADNFPVWANQANGMLQLSVWAALRELGVGASLQHYNPVIDDKVKQLFDIPKSYKLIAQMPFGGIIKEPEKKEKEDIDKRVTVIK